MPMQSVSSRGRFPRLAVWFACAVPPASALLLLLVSVHTDALGQASPPQAATPPTALTGTGEQMRVLAAVCKAWEAARKSKTRAGGKADSSDIRDYNFAVTQEAAVYKVRLTPKKPVIRQIPTGAGVYQENDSATFFYDVRRSDFKIVGVSAIR